MISRDGANSVSDVHILRNVQHLHVDNDENLLLVSPDFWNPSMSLLIPGNIIIAEDLHEE